MDITDTYHVEGERIIGGETRTFDAEVEIEKEDRIPVSQERWEDVKDDPSQDTPDLLDGEDAASSRFLMDVYDAEGDFTVNNVEPVEA